MEGSLIVRDRSRPRKSIGETIKRDLDINGLNVNIIVRGHYAIISSM